MYLNTKPVVTLAGLCALACFSDLAFAHGMSEAEKTAAIEGGNLQYMWLGATHMLTGYDHLAFVFGIIFFLTSFRDIAKYVTAFTVGHSVTLIYATLNGIQFNYHLIDAVIAISVCYIAFANLDGFRKYLNIKAPNMMMMIVGLGLIHGLGLSTRLQELPLSSDNLLWNIISFNIGIELGQIAALCVMLLVISQWRKHVTFSAFSRFANYGLIIMGGLLFFMQMQGYAASPSKELLVTKGERDLQKKADGQKIQESHKSKVTKWRDIIQVTIAANSGKEYKVSMKKDASLEFSWKTGGEALYFDFHGEPKGDTTGYFESFKEGTLSEATGSLVAPFEGTHGWYWKNTSASPVTVTLNTKGDYERMD